MEFGPDRDRKVKASKKPAVPAGEALDGGSAPRGRAPVDLPAPGAPKHPLGDRKALVPGARVRVVECSGVDSRREGVIVPNSHASEINRQPPGKPSWRENPYGSQYGEPGRYKDFDPKSEAIIRDDKGALFTMYRDRLQLIPSGGELGSGAAVPFVPPHARTSPEAIGLAHQAHDLAVQATDLHGELRMQTINALVKTQKADTKELHSDAAYLHDQLSEAHRKMAATFRHLPGMAHVHDSLSELHHFVKEEHRRAMGLARSDDFKTPEGTDAFYLRNYGVTNPPERETTDKVMAGTHKVVAGVLVERLSLRVEAVPEGFMDDFIDRADSPADEYYPDGIKDDTLVSVVISHNGKSTVHLGQAQSFGWAKAAAAPAYAGLEAVPAPITHYKIIQEGERHGH